MFGFWKRDDPSTRLRMLMAELDINTQELADRAGISRSTVSALRTGRTKNPNPDTAFLIARVLGVKTSSIWGNR